MISGVLKSINKGINKLIKTQNKFSINGKEYIEEKLLAEGGFGYVYIVEDPDSGKKFAMKKMNIMENSQLLNIKREIQFWSKVNNHANIVKMIEYEINQSSVFILMEFCSEGTLLDFINNRVEKTLNENQALFIVKEIASGIYHMHSQSPAIAHRDIKIENVLKVGNNFKLCDFGSASTETLDPKKETKSSLLENFSKFEKHTTFIKRPPEMCDPYSKFPIHEKVDVWMLGCILYALLFKSHPFQDAQKLTIINAQYYIPDEAKLYSEKIIDFVRLMLTPNPTNRPSAKDVIKIITNWSGIKQIDLPEETIEIKQKQLRNVKSTKTNLLTADDIYRAQQAILKKKAKEDKYKPKVDDDGDINEIFDDIDIGGGEVKNDKVKGVSGATGGRDRDISNKEDMNLKNRSKSPNLVSNNRPFEGFNNSSSGVNNSDKNKGEWMIDFDQGFGGNNNGSKNINNISNKGNNGNQNNINFDFNELGNIFSDKSGPVTNANVNTKTNTNNQNKNDFGDFVFSNNNNSISSSTTTGIYTGTHVKSKSNNQIPQIDVQNNSNTSTNMNQGGFNFDNKFSNNTNQYAPQNVNYNNSFSNNNNTLHFQQGQGVQNNNTFQNPRVISNVNSNTQMNNNSNVNFNMNSQQFQQKQQPQQSQSQSKSNNKGEQSIFDFFK